MTEVIRNINAYDIASTLPTEQMQKLGRLPGKIQERALTRIAQARAESGTLLDSLPHAGMHTIGERSKSITMQTEAAQQEKVIPSVQESNGILPGVRIDSIDQLDKLFSNNGDKKTTSEALDSAAGVYVSTYYEVFDSSSNNRKENLKIANRMAEEIGDRVGEFKATIFDDEAENREQLQDEALNFVKTAATLYESKR